jgi:hypothetical protein
MEPFKSSDSQKRNSPQSSSTRSFLWEKHSTRQTPLSQPHAVHANCNRNPKPTFADAQRAAMEDDFIQETLQTFLQDNHTCPKLACTLLEALRCDCHESRHPGFTSRHGATDPKHRRLHQRQALVGWSQLFQGRLVTDWSHLQEEFLDQHNDQLKLDRRCCTGDPWARKLVSLLWSTMRAQWDHRNADRHGRTKEGGEPEHPPQSPHATSRRRTRPGT